MILNLPNISSHFDEDTIDHKDAAAEFNRFYPEIGLTADQSAHLMKTFMNSNTASAVNQSTRELGYVGATSEEKLAPESTTTLPASNAATFSKFYNRNLLQYINSLVRRA